MASPRVDKTVVLLRISVFDVQGSAEAEGSDGEDEFAGRNHYFPVRILRPAPGNIRMILEIRLERFEVCFRRFEERFRRGVLVVVGLKDDGSAEERNAFECHCLRLLDFALGESVEYFRTGFADAEKVPGLAGETERFARGEFELKPHCADRFDGDGPGGDQIISRKSAGSGVVGVPLDERRMFAVEIDRAENGSVSGSAGAAEDHRVRRAGIEERHACAVVERGNGQQQGVEFADEFDKVRRSAPGESARFMNVDFLFCEPFDAVRESECAVDGSERGECGAHPCVIFGDGGQTGVVVSLRVVNHETVSVGFAPRVVQVSFDLLFGIVLEQFGIGPVHVGVIEQTGGDRRIAAEPLKQEDDVGKLFAHACDDVLPRGNGDHIAGVAAETVHAAPAPDDEDVCNIFPKIFFGVIKLGEVFPDRAPGAGGDDGSVVAAFEPFGVDFMDF